MAKLTHRASKHPKSFKKISWSRSSKTLLKIQSRFTQELAGSYRSRFYGSGIEYSDTRLYEPGDQLKHIDWRTSAKTGSLLTKIFSPEGRLQILLVINATKTFQFGSSSRLKAETLIEAVGLIGQCAMANQDNVSVILPVRSLWNVDTRTLWLGGLIHEIQSSINNSDDHFDSMIDTLLSRQASGNIIFFFDDNPSPSQETLRKIQLLGTQNDTVYIDIYDSAERDSSTLLPTASGWKAVSIDTNQVPNDIVTLHEESDILHELLKFFWKKRLSRA